MKKLIGKTNTSNKRSALFGLVLLFSYTSPPGGEGFEIFLNNKVVLQRFGDNMQTVKTLKLHQAAPDDELAIIYHHCGQFGKKRSLAIKDEKNNLVKKWSFSDDGPRLILKIKEIVVFQKENKGLKLFYYSGELPDGRQLAWLYTGSQDHSPVAIFYRFFRV